MAIKPPVVDKLAIRPLGNRDGSGHTWWKASDTLAEKFLRLFLFENLPGRHREAGQRVC